MVIRVHFADAHRHLAAGGGRLQSDTVSAGFDVLAGEVHLRAALLRFHGNGVAFGLHVPDLHGHVRAFMLRVGADAVAGGFRIDVPGGELRRGISVRFQEDGLRVFRADISADLHLDAAGVVLDIDAFAAGFHVSGDLDLRLRGVRAPSVVREGLAVQQFDAAAVFRFVSLDVAFHADVQFSAPLRLGLDAGAAAGFDVAVHGHLGLYFNFCFFQFFVVCALESGQSHGGAVRFDSLCTDFQIAVGNDGGNARPVRLYFAVHGDLHVALVFRVHIDTDIFGFDIPGLYFDRGLFHQVNTNAAFLRVFVLHHVAGFHLRGAAPVLGGNGGFRAGGVDIHIGHVPLGIMVLVILVVRLAVVKDDFDMRHFFPVFLRKNGEGHGGHEDAGRQQQARPFSEGLLCPEGHDLISSSVLNVSGNVSGEMRYVIQDQCSRFGL